MRWGMVIDLNKCAGCYSCQISCKAEHALPPDVFWARCLISERGAYPAVTKQILPVLCNHCKEAPCLKVCPTGATNRRDDGIIYVDYDKCMGCRYCVIACPYQHRTFLSDSNKGYHPEEGLTELEVMTRRLYPLQEGTVVKCNFCMERVSEGLMRGLKPGVDREATPVCVINCPANARYFGDLDDPSSEVASLVKVKKGTTLHHEYGTDPSVYYLNY